MSDASEARLVDLEVRYTYLERVVRELDNVVIDLQMQVDKLRRDLTELGATRERSSPGNEKPPHY